MSYSELNSHTPTEEVKRDPALKALNAQLPAIRQAFELMKQSQEISEKVKMSMEALVPALEVQLYGLNSEIEQHVLNQEETENAYASVVRKLEDQLRIERFQFEERENAIRKNCQEEISQMRKTLGHMNEELSKAIELTNIYQKLYHDLRDQQKLQQRHMPVKVNGNGSHRSSSMNMFHVYDLDK
ncbi:MAG: hypothetical protein AAGD28_08195 [Bacteroidota bacterium]